MELAFYWYIILFFAAIFGGFVGAASGGAGMITMPMLLLSGLNPLAALATNKIQAFVGSFTSAVSYYNKGLVDFKSGWILMLIAMICAGLGALSVQFVDINLLKKIIPFLLIGVGIYFLFSPKVSDQDIAKSPNKAILYSTIAFAGFYGGILGMGIGSFIIAILVAIGGFGMSKALALSRWIAFSINILSTLVFVLSGNAVWILAILMCAGQIIGARLGVFISIKHGARVIRPMVCAVCFLSAIYLIYKEFFAI